MRDERILRRLPELPTLHLTPPNIREIKKTVMSERLVEVTRITGALSFPAHLDDPEENDALSKAMAIVNEANTRRVGPPATLTLVTIPYHHVFGPVVKPNAYPGPDCPPTCTICDCDQTCCDCTDDPRQTCHDVEEIETYEARINAILKVLGAQKTEDVVVGQQYFNAERWARNDIEPGWNAALTAKNDAIFLKGKELLPNAPIYRYERGGVACVGNGQPYTLFQSSWYTLDEEIDEEDGDNFNVSLYTIPDLDRTQQTLIETASFADGYGVTQVMPWIGLACGFRELGTAVPFRPDWDYGVRAIRDLARWLGRENFKYVYPYAFYPEPFALTTPRWLQYFAEYVRGFMG